MRMMLREVPQLPASLAALDVDAALGAFRVDKKHRDDAYAAILVDADGQLERRLLPRTAATEAQLEAVFSDTRGLIDEIQ
jgi:3-dehydroquinate synthetase